MLCVIAKLNNDATEKLESLRKAALPPDLVVKPLYGHITVAAYTGDEETSFIQLCKEQMSNCPAFHIEYSRIEVLEETSILVALPGESETLAALHEVIAENCHDTLDKWTRIGCWYPHTTLLYAPHLDLHALCCEMRKVFVPFAADICRFEFSRVLEDGFEIVDSVDLPFLINQAWWSESEEL